MTSRMRDYGVSRSEAVTECELLQASKPQSTNGLEPRIRYTAKCCRPQPCGFVAALGRRCRVAHNSTGPTSVSIDLGLERGAVARAGEIYEATGTRAVRQ